MVQFPRSINESGLHDWLNDPVQLPWVQHYILVPNITLVAQTIPPLFLQVVRQVSQSVGLYTSLFAHHWE